MKKRFQCVDTKELVLKGVKEIIATGDVGCTGFDEVRSSYRSRTTERSGRASYPSTPRAATRTHRVTIRINIWNGS